MDTCTYSASNHCIFPNVDTSARGVNWFWAITDERRGKIISLSVTTRWGLFHSPMSRNLLAMGMGCVGTLWGILQFLLQGLAGSLSLVVRYSKRKHQLWMDTTETAKKRFEKFLKKCRDKKVDPTRLPSVQELRKDGFLKSWKFYLKLLVIICVFLITYFWKYINQGEVSSREWPLYIELRW